MQPKDAETQVNRGPGRSAERLVETRGAALTVCSALESAARRRLSSHAGFCNARVTTDDEVEAGTAREAQRCPRIAPSTIASYAARTRPVTST